MMKNLKWPRSSGLFAVLSCVLLFAACKVSEQYTVKDMALPEAFRLPDSVAQDLDDAIIPWDRFFKDTVLLGLIDSAFTENFSIRTANKEIAINNQYYKESKAAFLPSFNLRLLNIEREWSSRNSGDSPEEAWYKEHGTTPPDNLFVSTTGYTSTAALDWEVDIWGKLKNQKRAASALYRQSFEARKAIQTEVVATIAEDYYRLLMLDEQLKVAKKNYNFRDSTLRMIQLLYKSGEVTALAVQQSRSQVLEASALIPDLEKQRAIQENKLRLLTGALPKSIRPTSTLSSPDSSYNAVDSLPLYLVQNRPDVVMARYQLKAANANVGVTQAARYPNVTISLTGGVGAVLAKNWFNVPGSLLGGIVGGLTAPVLNGRQLKTDFEVAKLKRAEAEINFQRTVYGAIVDIKNSLIAIDKLTEQLAIAKEQQRVSEKAVESSRMLFRSGFATYLEVITAQGEALESELNLVKAKANLLTQRIQLYRALGGGWQSTGRL